MSVPVTKGQYSDNETRIFSYLTSKMGLNKASACGVLANIQKESSFNPTATGDSGTSYGICQWHQGRYTNLRNYCKNNNLNFMSVDGQLAYLQYELQNSYPAVLNILKSVPNTAEGAWEAGAQWCARFEVPAGYGSWNNGVLTLGPTSRSRGDLAKNTYWSAYANESTSTAPLVNKGNLIVAEAKKHLGKPYVWGAEGPNGFDCSGFVYYVYKQAINYDWGRTTAYQMWKKYGRTVSRDSMKAGDLIYFVNTYSTGNSPNISHIGIATGNGSEFIQASGDDVNMSSLSNSYWDSHFYSVKRVLSDADTGGYVDVGTGVIDPLGNALALTNVDNYLDIIESTISSIEDADLRDSTGRRYGYLIDLTNGGEFKFYVPEYSDGASVNWDDISIIGRSSSIKAYNSTQSRTVDITVQLVAGIGFYTTGEDRINDMIKDVEFVKSLAYPDYSKAIVLPPPTVLLYLNPTMKLRGVVSQARADYKKPYDNKNRPMVCDLSFTVVQDTNSPADFNDVRNRTSYSY